MSVSDHGSRGQITIVEIWSLSTLNTFILPKQNSALFLVIGSFFNNGFISKPQKKLCAGTEAELT